MTQTAPMLAREAKVISAVPEIDDDAFGRALANYRQAEREIHEAHLAMIRDLREVFPAPVRVDEEKL